MTQNKTVLTTFLEEDYRLIAIHCSLEAYKLAFLLNKNLEFKLERERKDIDFYYPEATAYYQLYKFENLSLCCNFYLVGNKYKAQTNQLQSNGSLFAENTSFTAFLVSEYKNVDFFLKIEDCNEDLNITELLQHINQINNVVTAYEVDLATLKSKENLIFS